MCSGISLSWRELPEELIVQHQLQYLEYKRPPQGDVEYHFLYYAKKRCLPVWHCGELSIFCWSGFSPREQLEANIWRNRNPVPVTIPVTFICDGGVWYPIKESVQGVLVQNQVYIITQPADHYHKIMTGSSRMVVEKPLE